MLKTDDLVINVLNRSRKEDVRIKTWEDCNGCVGGYSLSYQGGEKWHRRPWTTNDAGLGTYGENIQREPTLPYKIIKDVLKSTFENEITKVY